MQTDGFSQASQRALLHHRQGGLPGSTLALPATHTLSFVNSFLLLLWEALLCYVLLEGLPPTLPATARVQSHYPFRGVDIEQRHRVRVGSSLL